MASPLRHTPLDELELYETLIAAYPERFANREESDELWDEVQEFAEGLEEHYGHDTGAMVRDLIGRLVMLAPVLRSDMTGAHFHALVQDQGVHFTTVVRRKTAHQGADPA